MQKSCYKFMFAMGLLDLPALMVSAILTGWLSIEGAVYCSHPTFIYSAGAVGLGNIFLCFIFG